MVNGISAAFVSRIAFPLSHVSTNASFSRFSSIRSAILLSKVLRSVAEDLFQVGAAFHAALTAKSISFLFDLGTLAMTLPSTGDLFSKYSPSTGATHSPPI